MNNNNYTPRLRYFYLHKVVPKLKKDLKIDNVMAVPCIKKITLNMGVGKFVKDKKLMEFTLRDLAAISGQKPIVTKSKKSISGFKIRSGWPIGCKVTLRRDRMYEFLDRLISIAIPRIRDFRGLSSRSFDGRGNYSLGIKEQISFPEIDYDKIHSIHGMDVTITTNAKNDKFGYALLRAFNFPLK